MALVVKALGFGRRLSVRVLDPEELSEEASQLAGVASDQFCVSVVVVARLVLLWLALHLHLRRCDNVVYYDQDEHLK